MAKTTLRVLASGAILAALILGFRDLVITPLRCNVALKSTTRFALVALQTGPRSPRVALLIRERIAQLAHCLDRCPENVSVAMVLALAYRVVGRHADAIHAYRSALEYERRPELYFNLGNALIEAGDTEEGLQNLVTAAILNPELADDCGQFREAVLQEIERYKASMKSATGR